MSPRTRADLLALSGYQPGEAAAGAVKLSSNESGFAAGGGLARGDGRRRAVKSAAHAA